MLIVLYFSRMLQIVLCALLFQSFSVMLIVLYFSRMLQIVLCALLLRNYHLFIHFV